MLPSPTRASKTSRKAILASEKLQDYGMSKAIERALLQVFKNPSYLPHDPYKTLLQSLRQSEVGQDLNMPRVVAYTEMAPEGSVPETCSEFTTAKLAAFGDSKGIGLRHLAKLVSLSAINRVYSVMVALKEALGSLPREAKTRGIEATFMEAVPVCMCMSDALSRPVTHRLEVTVEALIKNVSDKSQASFDDCLMLFIRRVVEEAYLADRCADIVTDHIQVVMGVSGRHVQVIPLKTMRSRRQQVLSILKAAVVDDGEISLDMYLMLRRNLPAFGPAAQTEPSFGYVHVTRRYRFSYCDERGLMRCFSTYPFESLARGVFFEPKDAKLYLQVYTQHHARTMGSQPKDRDDDKKKRGRESEGESGVGDVLLSSILYLLASESRARFEAGEVVLAAEGLLQLQALLTPASPTVGPALRQTAQLCSGALGQIHCVREALASIEGAVGIISSSLQDSDYLKTSLGGAPITGAEAAAEYQLLLQAYESVSPALLELKFLLQQLFRDCRYSELQYLRQGVMETFFRTFDPVTRAAPLCQPDPSKLSRACLAGVLPVLDETRRHLEATRHVLLALEASLAADVLLSVMGSDPLGVQVDTLGLDTIDNNHSWHEVPKTLLEYLGFMAAYGVGGKPSKASVLRRPWKGLLWTGPLWRMLTTGMERAVPAARQSDKFLQRRPPNPYLDPEVEDATLRAAASFWDIVAALGMHGAGRHAAIDYVAAVADETARYGFPRFMSPEGAKMRYLVETHAIRGLQEGLFMSATHDSSAAPPFSALNLQLFKYSSYYQLHCHAPRALLMDLLFRAAKTRDCLRAPPLLNGAVKIAVTGDKAVGLTLGSEPLSLLGGLIGPNRLLSGLGPNAVNIFRLAWQLPQMFESPPSPQAGMVLTVCLGVAAETALQWAGASSLGGTRLPHAAASALPSDSSTSAPAQSATAASALPPLGSADLPDPELHPICQPGPIVLELAVRVKCDQSGLEARARKQFGSIVADALAFMGSGSDWRVLQVLAGGSSEDLAALGVGALHSVTVPASTGIKVYPTLALAEDGKLLGSLQQQASKFGAAVFVCSVAMPLGPGQLTHEQLIKVFERIVYDAAARADVAAPEQGDGFGPAQEDPAFSDPTYNDVDRLCASGKASSQVQALLAQSVRVYVPCVLRLTLLTTHSSYQAPQVDSGAALANPAKRGGDRSSSSSSSSSSFDSSSADPTQPALPRVQNNCPIGSDGALARLVGATVWLSQEAAAAVWRCTSAGGLSCLEREAAVRAAAVRALRRRSRYAEAQMQGLVWSLLSRRYDLTPLFARQASSLGQATWRLLQFVDVVQVLLEREDAVTLDTHVLGMTLVGMVALPLRRVLTAPSSVHLRGGCAVLLQRLRQLERTLHLGSLPLHLATCPNQLPDNFSTATADAPPPKATSKPAPKGPARPPGSLAIDPAGLKVVTPADAALRRALNSSVEVCRSAVDSLKSIFGIASTLLEALGRDVDSWEVLYGLDAGDMLEGRWRDEARRKGLYGPGPQAATATAAAVAAENATGDEAARAVPEVSTADAADLIFPWPEPEASSYRPHHHAHEDWIRREGDGTTQERLAAFLRARADKAARQADQQGRGVMRNMMQEISAARRMDREHKVFKYGEGQSPVAAPTSLEAEPAEAVAAAANAAGAEAASSLPESPVHPEVGSPAPGRLWRTSKAALQFMSPSNSPRKDGAAATPRGPESLAAQPPLEFGTLRKMQPRERAEFLRLAQSLAKADQQLADMRAGQAQEAQAQAAQSPKPVEVPSKLTGFGGFGFGRSVAAAAAANAAAAVVGSSSATRGGPVHDAGSPSRLGLGATDWGSLPMDYSQTFSASGFALPGGVAAQGQGMLLTLRQAGRGVDEKREGWGVEREVGLGVTDNGLLMGAGLEEERHPHLTSFRMLSKPQDVQPPSSSRASLHSPAPSTSSQQSGLRLDYSYDQDD